MKSLIKTPGYAALVLMIFLNAFIDLGHKIVIQNIIFKLYDGPEQIILTAIVNALILLPFIVFFRPAGLACDRYRKHQVLRISSLTAFILTLAISFCYYHGLFQAAFIFIFILAIQSAFYAPAKYAYLKESVDNTHLTGANGFAQSMATLGIFVGIFAFSILFEQRLPLATQQTEEAILQAMFPLSGLLIISSIIETLLAWTLPKNAPCKPAPKSCAVDDLVALKKSPALWTAAIGTSVFWSAGQMLLATYPAFAKAELGITNTVVIQGLLAMNAIGVMLGSITAGFISKKHIEIHLIALSSIGLLCTVFLLPITTYIPLVALLFLGLGFSGGLLVVPLNAILQYCSAAENIGKTLANTVLIQNTAMLSCLVITIIAASFHIGPKALLLFIALFSCIGLVYVLTRMPHSLLRFKLAPLMGLKRKHIEVEGFNDVPGYGQITFILDDLSTRNLQLLQLSYPRDIDGKDCSVISAADFIKNKRCNQQYIHCHIHKDNQYIKIGFSKSL